MSKGKTSIKSRIRDLILLTSTIVLVATSTAFIIYGVLNFKSELVGNLSTLAHVIADNSAAPLAFSNKQTAEEILAALKADPDIMAAALYDDSGQLFASYPQVLPADLLPGRVASSGHHFRDRSLFLFQPVIQERKPIGTLYLRSSLRGLFQRLWQYAGIVGIILAGSFAGAFFLSTLFQRRISGPILALTNAAQAVAERDDYSVRAPKLSEDEIGILTDSFNTMLAETQAHQGRVAEQARLLDLSFDAIIVVDAGNRITYWNRGAAEMYGYAREEALGQVVNDLLKTQSPEPAERILEKLHRDNRWVGELAHTRKDGVTITVSTRLALDRDARGNPASILETNTDITQRKRTEEELRRAVEFDSAVMTSMGEGLYTVDAQGLVTYMNPAAERLFGWSFSELHGRNMHQMTHHHHPDGTPFPAEDCAGLQVLKEGRALTGYEDAFIRKNGTFFDVLFSCSPITSADQITGLVVMFRDISERKQAQKALRESQATLEAELAALARLHDLSARLWRSPDLKAGLEEMVAAVIALAGASMGNIQLLNREQHALEIVAQRGFNQEFLDFFHQVSYEDDSACGRALRTGQRCIIEDSEAYFAPGPHREIARSASYRAEQSTPLLDGDGALLGVFSTHWREPHRPSETELRKLDLYARQAADFIARVQAQEILRENEAKKSAVLESALDCIIAMDQEGRITEFNPAAEKTFGWRREQVLGKTVAETFIPSEFRQAHEHGLAHFLRTGEGPVLGKRIEMTALRADGTRFPVELSISVSVVPGHAPFFTAYLRDLTERKRAEEALAKAQGDLQAHAGKLEETVAERTAQLRETVGELEAYSYSVTHDMRAPLRAMTAYAQALTEDFSQQLPVPARNYLGNIASAAKRMDQLITDVLAYSRVSRSQRNLEPIDPENLIAEIISHYPELQPPKADIQIQSPLPSVIGDQPSLAQCVSNLLTNAVKFVAPGTKPVIRIWSEVGEASERGASERQSVENAATQSRSDAPTQRRSDAPFVRLWFEDNGIGIEEKNLSRIFGIFERVHSQQAYQGTGIGLAIVKKAVERMGGQVGVQSSLGKGTRFWLQLGKAEQ